MSNQGNRNKSGVTPAQVAAGVGLGVLAAVGGYLFGRYQESEEQEKAEAAAAHRQASQPRPRQNSIQNQAQPQQLQTQDSNDDYPKKPGGLEKECIICFREFADLMNNDEEIHTTPCGHIFCKKCLTKSLAERERCPICREVVRPGQTIRIYM